MNDEKHREATGVSYRAVLENLILLTKTRKPLILRTPIIPCFNDTAEEIAAIAAWAVRHLPSMLYYELLPYHPLGQKKYALLGEIAPAKALPSPELGQMRALAKAAIRAGAKVWVSGKPFEEN